MEGNSGQNDDYGCSSSVGVPAPLVLDMFQGVTYKYFSLNNNVTDIVFHTEKVKAFPYHVKILFPH